MTINSKKIINGFYLKLIALICMFFDHTASVVLNSFPEQTAFLQSLSQIFWFLGRMAFPLYCFLLVEGFLHTKNLKKYAGRLLCLAILSEIPYDLAFNDTILEFGNNNVFFTLFLGLLLIWVVSFIEKKGIALIAKGKNRYFIKEIGYMAVGIVLFIAVFIAIDFLKSDYGFLGLLVILAMYLLRQNVVLGAILSAVILTVLSNAPMEIASVFSVVPIAFYNGEKGKSAKSFFYSFYPMHLLLLAILREFLLL